MALKSNAQDAVTRWKAGVANSGPRYTQGVQRVNDWYEKVSSPDAVAARNAGLQAAMQPGGAMDRGLQRAGTSGWKAATVAKASNWQTGVNSPTANANAQAGFQRLFGYLGAADNAISNMPRGSIEQNIARFSTWARAMHDAAQADK